MRALCPWLLLWAVSSCAPAPPVGGEGAAPAAAAPSSPFAGDWRISSIGGQAPLRGSTVTLSLADGRISGSGGCNRYMGRYQLADSPAGGGAAIEITGLASTMMACADDVMRQEDRFLSLLGKLRLAQADRAQLLLTTSDGQQIIARRP